MKQNRASPPWLAIAVIVAVLIGALLFSGCGPADAAPALSGELRLGAATPTAFDYGSGDTVFGIEAVAKVAHLAGPLSVSASCRHFFSGDTFADSKSRMKLNADFDIGGGASLFAEYQRAYRVGSDWGWAGLRLRL